MAKDRKNVLELLCMEARLMLTSTSCARGSGC